MTDPQPAARTKRVVIDLTPLTKGRVHLHGFDCALLRALRALRGVSGGMPGQAGIEFWEVSNTNPANVKCVDCWRENAEVQHAFAVAHPLNRYPRVGR